MKIIRQSNYPVVFFGAGPSGADGLLQRPPGSRLVLLAAEGRHHRGQGAQDGPGLLGETRTLLWETEDDEESV